MGERLRLVYIITTGDNGGNNKAKQRELKEERKGNRVETHPNLFMRLLTIPTLLHNSHNNILRSHERQLLCDPPCDDFRIDHEAFRYVLECGEDDVGGEEGFGEGDAAVGTIERTSQSSS
jgi:hypothetical protein